VAIVVAMDIEIPSAISFVYSQHVTQQFPRMSANVKAKEAAD
jgi:hypothetical protein